ELERERRRYSCVRAVDRLRQILDPVEPAKLRVHASLAARELCIGTLFEFELRGPGTAFDEWREEERHRLCEQRIELHAQLENLRLGIEEGLGIELDPDVT